LKPGRIVWVIVAAVGVAACTEFLTPENAAPPREVRALRVMPAAVTLDDQDTARLVATAYDQNGQGFDTLPSGVRLDWSTSAPAVAVVDSTGLVRGAHPGQVQVTASVVGGPVPLSAATPATVLPVPAALAAIAGDSQAGTVGARLPEDLRAKITDRFGDPVPGVTVGFALTAGRGALSDSSVVTDSLGEARVALALDTTTGISVVEARTARLPRAVARFRAEARPDVPAAVTVVSGDNQGAFSGAALPMALVVRVADRYGNAVPGVTVTWEVTSGDGSVAPPLSVTDSLGLATTTWTMGTGIGPQAVRAGIAGTLSAGFIASARTRVTRVVVTPASPTVAMGDSLAFTASPRDSADGAVPGRAAAWASSDTGIATVDTAGVLRARALGAVTVTAVIEGISGSTVATVTPGPPSAARSTVSVSRDTIRVGETATFMLRARDAFDNAVTTGGRTVVFSTSGGTGTGVIGATVDSGNGAYTATFAGVSAGTAVTVGASIDGAPVTSSLPSVTVVPAAPTLPLLMDIPGPDLIGLGLTNPLDVTLPGPAGPGGVTVTITSDSAALITPAAPGTVLIPEGQTTGRVTLSGLALGTTTLRATATGYVDASLAVQVSATAVPTAANEIAVGSGNACAIKTDGQVYCWGSNQYGQVGLSLPDGSTLPRQAIPQQVVSVSASSGAACGLTSAQVAGCWGYNHFGQLGRGTTSPDANPTPFSVVGGLTFAKVVIGWTSACGLTPAGAVYCWGDNSFGQIGDGGPSTTRLTPTPVAGNRTFKDVSLIGAHVCALTTGGEAFCWGFNLAGQVGDGTTINQPVPTAVGGGLRFAQVSSGLVNTCGLTASGSAYCWGSNTAGALGNGSTTASTMPVAVQGGLSFTMLSSGGSTICGLNSGGAAYCWGNNAEGEVGDGSTTNRLTPTAVSGGHSFRSLSSGWSAACGVTTAGEIWCWGSGSSGQLGDGLTADRNVPFRVTPGGVPVSLSFAVQPTTTLAGQVMAPAVQVAVEDGFGAPAATPDTLVLWLYYVTSGPTYHYDQLTGGFAGVVNGVATFPDLVAPGAGTGLSLVLRLAPPGTSHDLNPCGLGVAPTCGVPFTAQSDAFDVTAPVTHWDATADFSGTANPNGAWSSGYTATLGSTFILFPAFESVALDLWYDPTNFAIGTPIFGKNVSASTAYGVPPGEVTLHPGCNASEYAELRWTAPQAGSYLANVQFFAGDGGNTDAAVLVNGGAPVFTVASTNTNPSYSSFLSLAAGDRIQFAVGTGGDGCTSDNTPIRVTVLATTAVTLSAHSATTQSATVGTPAATPPSVLVTDGSGNPIAGMSVSFQVTAGGGSLTGATQVTDQNGIATVGGWTLGAAPGTNTVSASIAGVTAVSFDASGVAGAPAQLAFVVQPSSVLAGAAISPPVRVAVQDAQGNLLASATGSVTVALGTGPGGATLAGTVTQPLVSGTATFADLVVNGPTGTYGLAASYAGVPIASSASFDVTAPPPAVSIDIAGADVVGVGRVTPLTIRLSRPADAGGVAVQVSSDAPGIVGVAGASVLIAGGDSVAADTLSGVALGTATVRAGITGQSQQELPVLVTDQVNPVVGDSLSVGGLTNCAIRAGAAWCWGYNAFGELGDGTTTNRSTPVAVQGGHVFVAITNGSLYTCALTADGSAWCWGANALGQLGDGTNNASTAPVAVAGGLHFARIQAGGGAHTCGVTTGGALYCWGSLPFRSASFNTPVAAPGNQTWHDVDVKTGTCGLATVGTMLCIGPTAASPLSLIAGMPDVVQPTVGWGHICGLAPDGKPWCQGSNSHSQLGYGMPGDVSNTANPILGSEVFTSISTGDYANCGVTTTGAAFCWGWNPDGQLGDGTTTDHLQPAAVAGGLAFAVVKTGQETSCGVTSTGEVWCWGLNNVGQIGDGTTTSRLVPAKAF
jgi:alpha-tubulin suppressor-like RCC1 family protein